jgi:hypothetical protein
MLRGLPPRLPRFDRELQRVEDERKLRRVVLEVDDDEPDQVVGVTAAGDPRRLRGIPAVGRGTGGAIAGSDPLAALIAKEGRRRR